MAAGSDSESLLTLLCDAARDLGGADGAVVARLAGADGIVLAASGIEAPDAGTMFGVGDSLAGNAIRSRSLIVEHDDPALACPIFREQADVGEVAVAPLIAADQPVGLLCAWHRDDGSGFSVRDRQRLRTIADHASVVLVKARLLEEAQVAAQAKGAFLATISHELRTPLTALTGYGELLADEILGPLSAHQLDMVDRMRSVTHQLAVMVDELLTFSALEAGRETVHPSDVSLADIMDGVIAVIEPLARQKSLQLAVSLPNRPIALYTDADKVRQILVNLMGNAVKFTDHGRVDVAVSRRNGELQVQVCDTGIGIAMKTARVCFSRSRSSTRGSRAAMAERASACTTRTASRAFSGVASTSTRRRTEGARLRWPFRRGTADSSRREEGRGKRELQAGRWSLVLDAAGRATARWLVAPARSSWPLRAARRRVARSSQRCWPTFRAHR